MSTSKEINSNLTQARRHLEHNEPGQAYELLIAILKTQPDNTAALLMLGGYYFSNNQLQEAEMVFEQLITLEPTTGQYSIALFNTLWKLNRLDEAFEEIRRFMAVADRAIENETFEQYIEIAQRLSQHNDSNN